MRKNLFMCLSLFIIIPGLLLIFSCSKETVLPDPDIQSPETQAVKPETIDIPEEPVTAIEEEGLQQEDTSDSDMANKEKLLELERNKFVNERIYFAFDNATLSPESQEILRRKVKWLMNNSNESISIEGYCDERGTFEYNLALGERRALNAKIFLQDMGIASERVTTVSYGEENPIVSDKNEQAWAKNRRCEFLIK